MTLTIQVTDAQVRQVLEKVKAGLTVQAQDQVVMRAAWRIHRGLVERTPKKWTGHVRHGWAVKPVAPSHYVVWNRTKVMTFLEKGTKAHGPVRARALFLPMNARTAHMGAKAVHAANLAAHSAGQPLPFVYGRDFIFRKKVAGIQPMRIVENYVPIAHNILVEEMKQYIEFLISS